MRQISEVGVYRLILAYVLKIAVAKIKLIILKRERERERERERIYFSKDTIQISQ